MAAVEPRVVLLGSLSRRRSMDAAASASRWVSARLVAPYGAYLHRDIRVAQIQIRSNDER